MNTLATSANGSTAARFVLDTCRSELAPEVLDAAKKCLVDWCGVALGGAREPAAASVRSVVAGWGGAGNAQVLLGGCTSASGAALINGTMAHCLDFDDTHVGSTAHVSAPTWAAVLALGTHHRVRETDMLKSFAAGFEVGARLGGREFGVEANQRGWHSTGIFGCLAAAAGAAGVLGFDDAATRRALGAAATQTGGVTGSFGTMSKPFHAGKAAFNGVLSAELAATGFEPALTLLDDPDGLAGALVQDRRSTMPAFDAYEGWELIGNTFKPYACCLLTHATVDAARSLAPRCGGKRIERIEVRVNPLCAQLAGKPAPRTPLEGKFSTAFCTALGLRGYSASQADFCVERIEDGALQELVARVVLVPAPQIAKTAAELAVTFEDGTSARAVTALAKGNPGNPMTWDDMRAKFMPLAEPVLGREAATLFDLLREFERPGHRDAFCRLVGRSSGN